MGRLPIRWIYRWIYAEHSSSLFICVISMCIKSRISSKGRRCHGSSSPNNSSWLSVNWFPNDLVSCKPHRPHQITYLLQEVLGFTFNPIIKQSNYRDTTRQRKLTIKIGPYTLCKRALKNTWEIDSSPKKQFGRVLWSTICLCTRFGRTWITPVTNLHIKTRSLGGIRTFQSLFQLKLMPEIEWSLTLDKSRYALSTEKIPLVSKGQNGSSL